jgi:hypothetical protein
MRAYYAVWKEKGNPTDIVGFQGYRKHIDIEDPYPSIWKEVGLERFQKYQEYLAWQGEQTIRNLLSRFSMIVTPSFPLIEQGGMAKDFCVSRSRNDWDTFVWLANQFERWEWDRSFVTSHWFITTRAVFNRFMKEWWAIFSELENFIKSRDACDPAYPPRALDFLTERFFTVWMHREESTMGGVRTVTLPLMICWGAK